MYISLKTENQLLSYTWQEFQKNNNKVMLQEGEGQK
jgi:hypothetical protein